MRPSTRDRLADVGLFLAAAGFSVLTADSVVVDPGLSPTLLAADQATGALACGALFLRRRWPVQLAVALLVAGTVSHFVTGATLAALYTVAVLRPPRTTGWLAVLAYAPVPVFLARAPDPGAEETDSALTYFALVAAALSWGLYVRSRRQLVASLRERAERAAEEARREAREGIAREMHDVLAHRLSLLSVHAGALEFHPDAPREEIRRAAGVVRDSAHQALEDLREVVGVLREPGGALRPQPVLADVARLVEEAREAGADVVTEWRVADPGAVPAAAGRTAYRVVQECLTNARKHAAGQRVTVRVAGEPGDGLAVEVRNRVPGAGEAAIPGGGNGLVGLAERVRLADGTLVHGRVGGDFRVEARIPWAA
ncbi:histidine kinase [Streptomyces sp. DSM 42041]|uniref:histidine kinase n=1 Tax=Streptomyces hazeniae TaxID=3075538 RepID=A0ABU2NYN7_9ACTN|nr:histidine kinase [Streptomyces sp. DSM 42041]MDT0382100.1 histidine kinase [Streptomyces sp. DSM 42041]